MSVPVISTDQMREWEEATWSTGVTEAEVITTVGKLVAQRALQAARPEDSFLILAGKGHNGDDARAAQKFLKDRNTILLNVSHPKAAAQAFVEVLDNRKASQRLWIIDGLFGIGLNRPLDEDWMALIETINHSGVHVLAVDVPSGLNAETGLPEGAAIRADITLTVGAPKLGLLLPQAIPFVGRLEVAPEIGLVPYPLTSELNWTLPEDFEGFPPRRPMESHKGSYGHVAIFAGSLGYHGASILAAHGALRAQPGLVSLYTQASVYVPVASQLQSAMVHPWKAGATLPKSCSAILIGPGLAAPDLTEDFKNEMRSLWRGSPLPVIIDASALDWLRPGPLRDGALRVITPHPGEAARLLNSSADAIQADRVTKLRELSCRFGNCVVVLKGHQTLVGRGTGDVFVNSSGNPLLAQGGSGDTLGGYISGLLAQPELQGNPVRTIRYAVWEHGAAADRLSQKQRNWTTDDLARELGR